MGRIIALQGKGNSGKTTTINLLPAILNRNGYRQVPGMRRNYGRDFLDVFENGTIRLGITSAVSIN
jgi:thymidylate kinase